MRMLGYAVAAAAILCAGSASADGLGEPLTTIGSWQILRSVDAMTDEASCVAIYDDQSYIQLTDTSFSVGYRGRGGIRSYEYRLDDNPSSGMQLPSRVEERIGAVILQGARFNQIIGAQRLRFRGNTLVSGSLTEDIDLTDVPAVMEVLRGPDC